MKNLYTILFFIFCGITTVQSYSQEIHLSQYFTAKMLNNPAQTGQINSDFRISLHHRNQWKAISTPFVLSTFSLEAKAKINRTSKFGFGLLLLNNQAGKSQLKQQVYSGNVAYQMKTNRRNDISMGLNIAYRQRSINLNDLAWDSQYNGLAYDPSLHSGEFTSKTKHGSIDFGFGLLWQHRSKAKFDIEYAASHYYQDQGFFVTNNDKLQLRQMANYTYYFTYKQFDIDVMSRVIMQGTSFESVVGSMAKYRYGKDSRHTNNMTSSFLTFGILYRYQDAIVPMFGYNYERTFSGYLSYDINVSKLHNVSHYRGAWEINLQYTGLFNDSRRKMSKLEKK